MRSYDKVGGRKGKPAYRTPSSYLANKSIRNEKERAPGKSARQFRRKSFGRG